MSFLADLAQRVPELLEADGLGAELRDVVEPSVGSDEGSYTGYHKGYHEGYRGFRIHLGF